MHRGLAPIRPGRLHVVMTFDAFLESNEMDGIRSQAAIGSDPPDPILRVTDEDDRTHTLEKYWDDNVANWLEGHSAAEGERRLARPSLGNVRYYVDGSKSRDVPTGRYAVFQVEGRPKWFARRQVIASYYWTLNTNPPLWRYERPEWFGQLELGLVIGAVLSGLGAYGTYTAAFNRRADWQEAVDTCLADKTCTEWDTDLRDHPDRERSDRNLAIGHGFAATTVGLLTISIALPTFAKSDLGR